MRITIHDPRGIPGDSVSTTTHYLLNPAYPNPFNSRTSISFNLDRAGVVDVGVFDVVGRRIVTLVESQMEAGQHSLVWNAEMSLPCENNRTERRPCCEDGFGSVNMNRAA